MREWEDRDTGARARAQVGLGIGVKPIPITPIIRMDVDVAEDVVKTIFICNTYNRYGGRRKRSAEETEVDVEQVKQNYLENSNKDTAEAVVMSDDAWTANTLLGPEYVKWTSYSAMLTYSLPDDDQIRDFAYFIYCMLNHTSS